MLGMVKKSIRLSIYVTILINIKDRNTADELGERIIAMNTGKGNCQGRFFLKVSGKNVVVLTLKQLKELQEEGLM